MDIASWIWTALILVEALFRTSPPKAPPPAPPAIVRPADQPAAIMEPAEDATSKASAPTSERKEK